MVSLVVENMQWIMLVGGVLTFSMLQALFMPGAVMQAMFGEEPAGPAASLVVRNWGALIAGTGALLIYAAFVPEWRDFALIFATGSKLTFIALVLSLGLFARRAAFAVVLDAILVAAFVLYLLETHALL